jgi:2-dehydro-3-deoxy-D-gluconate 5-dehydrogenase
MNMFDLIGRKAIVAGGAGDLGRTVVEYLCQAGVDVVILDIAEDVEDFARSLAKEPSSTRGSAVGLRLDLADRAMLASKFAQAVEILGTLDILVCVQGIQRRYPAENFPLEVWDEVLEINLTSIFELCQLAGRVMLAKGYGKIINFASMNSFTGGITIPAYAASKAGVALLTKALSNEWASKGICVNAIAPGYMHTKMTAAIYDDPVRYQEVLSRIPVARWGKPEDLCGPLLFLASPASDYVTGHILPVDGGWMGR